MEQAEHAGVQHDARKCLVCRQPRVGGRRQCIEFLGPQGFGDLDHEDARLGQQAVGHAGALGQRAQPGNGVVALVVGERPHRERHQEAHEVDPLADPPQVAHDRVAVDHAHQ